MKLLVTVNEKYVSHAVKENGGIEYNLRILLTEIDDNFGVPEVEDFTEKHAELEAKATELDRREKAVKIVYLDSGLIKTKCGLCGTPVYHRDTNKYCGGCGVRLIWPQNTRVKYNDWVWGVE